MSLKSAKQPTYEMVSFIRSLFESALKTNECLKMAVITGCLRISRESGLGRYDLTLKTQRIRKGRAIILEFKITDNISGLEKGCIEALEQIENLHYDNGIRKECYSDILKYGICFYKKECPVMKSFSICWHTL